MDEPAQSTATSSARTRYRFSGIENEDGVLARVAGVLTITADGDFVEVPGAECRLVNRSAGVIHYSCLSRHVSPTTGARTTIALIWDRAQPTKGARAAVGVRVPSDRACTTRSLGCTNSPGIPRSNPWSIRLKVVPIDDAGHPE
jgi:hypothetical protein